MQENDELKIKRATMVFRITTILILAVLLLSATLSYGWFAYNKKSMGIEEISNPTAIYINSGETESYIYIDLGLIDVTKGRYKDVVFCIKGVNVSYQIQLAYTTNNQFEFDLYPALDVTNVNLGVLTPTGTVHYITHGETPVEKIYATVSESAGVYSDASMLLGNYKNRKYVIKNSSEEIVEMPANTVDQMTAIDDVLAGEGAQLIEKLGISNVLDHYYSETYDEYTYVNKYAVPIYWQASSQINHIGHDEFVDYFILRVKWDDTSINNKETDIIYITAKNVI